MKLEKLKTASFSLIVYNNFDGSESFAKKNSDVKEIYAFWETSVTWIKDDKELLHTHEVEYDFKKKSARSGAIIRNPGPKKNSEINVKIKTKKWNVIKK